jgi:hypothetical protein
MKNVYKILVEKPFGRPRNKWEDIIKTYLREIARNVVDWNYLIQDRDQWLALLNMVMEFRGP